MITYANRQGREIGDTAEEYPGDDDEDDDDESYEDSEQSDDESDAEHNSSDDSSSSSHSDSDSSSSSNEDDDQGSVEEPEIQICDESEGPHHEAATQPNVQVLAPLINDDAATTNQPAVDQDAENGLDDDRMEEAEGPGVANPGVVNPGVVNPGVEDPGVENPKETPPTADDDQEQMPTDNEEAPADIIGRVTEQDQFESAEMEGCARAQAHNNMRPKHTIKHNRDKDFVYAMVRMMIASLLVSNTEAMMSDDALSLVTAQMSAKAGLKYFGSRGSEAIVKELRQLILLKVMTGCLPSDLTAEQKAKSLRYLMFLKEK
jgi:hypothetical protein